ncbi:hypothetical protein YPPY72_1716, partial [Yersinia pestis PY-72]
MRHTAGEIGEITALSTATITSPYQE